MAQYIDNKKLYAEMIKFRAACDAAKAKGEQNPIIPNEVGHAILLIANKLATKYNFSRYAFREDMISDGIETCIRYCDRFDPDKSTNPFSYFTQVIWFAFVQRIKKEEKQEYIKAKMLQRSALFNTLIEADDGQDFDTSQVNLDSDYIVGVIDKFEKRTQVKGPKNNDGEHDVHESD